MPDRDDRGEVAVLVSGGLDSAVLAVDLARQFARVHPIYVRFGLRWEAREVAGLRSFLGLVREPRIGPLIVIDEPVADLYGDHWSVRGRDVPGADSPDESVYLPGRNLLLAAKASVWCRLRGVEDLAFGSLSANPFPDSSPEFFRSFEATLTIGLGGPIRLIRPYSGLGKAEVVRRGAGLPLGETFSCLDPVAGLHCGACNKCEERRRAFRSAEIHDPTAYACAGANAGAGAPSVRERGPACIE